MDEGLILGLTEALRGGIKAYGEESDRTYKRTIEQKKMAKEEAEATDRLALLKDQRENEKLKLGLKKDEQGNWVQDEESQFIMEKKQKGLLMDAQRRAAEEGIIKTRAEVKKIDADRIRGPKLEKGMTTGGKIMPVSAVENLAASDQALRALEDAGSLSTSSQEMFGKGVGLLGDISSKTGVGDIGISAASIDSDLMSKAQTIGRYLEGGKLAEGDAKRYAKMLPNRSDRPEVVQNKIASLQRMIEQKLESDRAGYSAAGYKVGQQQARPVSAGLIGGVGKQPQSDTKVWEGVTYKKVGNEWVPQ